MQQTRDPAPEEFPEENAEAIPEPPPRRAVPDTDAFTIPGEATHWRAYRHAGSRREPLAHAEPGASEGYRYWPIDDTEILPGFSLSEMRRRWGTGDYRIQWLVHTSNGLRVFGAPVDLVVLPESHVQQRTTARTQSTAFAPRAETPFYAPESGGHTAEAFGYFQGFMGIFMQSVAVIETRAQHQIQMDRERNALEHERASARDREASAQQARLAELQLELTRKESRDSRASLVKIIESQSEQLARFTEVLEQLQSAGEDEDEEEGEVVEGEAIEPARPAVVEAVAEPMPPPEPDMLGKLADAGNAIGGALGNLGTVLDNVEKVAQTVRTLIPQAGANGPAASAPQG